MSCCIESAVVEYLKALDCTPIRPENHFVDQRECEDCLPYLVLKASATAGLKTSSVVQKIWTIDIKAYFSDTKKNAIREYRDLVEERLYEPGCLELVDCGCFCVQGTPNSSIRTVAGGQICYGLTFRGLYNRIELIDSVSISDSF